MLVLGLAAPAFADVTIKPTTGGKGMGMGGHHGHDDLHQGPQDADGHRDRRHDQTMIFDVDAQKLYSFDSKKKEADVWDMEAFGADAQSVDTAR